MRDVLSVWYCILVVGGMAVVMVDCDDVIMAPWCVVSSCSARTLAWCRAVVVDAAGGAADQLLSLLKAQQ